LYGDSGIEALEHRGPWVEDVLPRRWIRDAASKVANRLRESDNVGRARLDVFWYKLKLGLVGPRRLRRACESSIAITWSLSLAIKFQGSSFAPPFTRFGSRVCKFDSLCRIFTRVALEQPRRPHGFTRTFHIHQAHRSHQSQMCETTSPDRSIMTAFIHPTLFASNIVHLFLR
jgi:hypothetical protein